MAAAIFDHFSGVIKVEAQTSGNARFNPARQELEKRGAAAEDPSPAGGYIANRE